MRRHLRCGGGPLLFLTLWAAYQPFDGWKLPLSMSIALAKALIMVLNFMEQLRDSALAGTAAVVGPCWLGLLIGLTFTDVATRDRTPQGIFAQP